MLLTHRDLQVRVLEVVVNAASSTRYTNATSRIRTHEVKQLESGDPAIRPASRLTGQHNAPIF